MAVMTEYSEEVKRWAEREGLDLPYPEKDTMEVFYPKLLALLARCVGRVAAGPKAPPMVGPLPTDIERLS